jgi:CxC2 like cysteine cluster associated with KDZ transposases
MRLESVQKRKKVNGSPSTPTPNPTKRQKPCDEQADCTPVLNEPNEVESFDPFETNLSQPVVPNVCHCDLCCHSVFDLNFQSNYDYMLQWAPRIDSYLNIIYSQAAMVVDPLCSRCGKGEAIWRCTSCHASPLFCAACCRSEHETRPFHRIEMWNGSSFEPSWLWKVGTCLYSGHGGKPCPNLPTTSFTPPSAEDYQKNARSGDNNLNDLTFGASPDHGTHASTRELVIVHTNGVHEMLIHMCQCTGRKSEDLQVLELGLYPSSFLAISTVFTFSLLDDFLLTAMECNTTAQQYYGKIRRHTSKDFPDSVKVCLLSN